LKQSPRRPLLTPVRASLALHALVLGLLVYLAPAPVPAPREAPVRFRLVGDVDPLPDEPPPDADELPAAEPVDTLEVPDFDVLLPALAIEEDPLPPEESADAPRRPVPLLHIPRGATRRPAAPAAAAPVVTARPAPPPPPRALPRPVPRVVRRPGTLRGFYPREAQEAGIEGTTMVLVSVDGRGQVIDARVRTSSGDASLDRAALRVARLYEFAPGTPGRALLPVPFRLRD